MTLTKQYRHHPVGFAELKDLAVLAEVEERRFFGTNPHTIQAYRDRLLAVALCQGAALQFIGRGYGVADFDIHYFYNRNPQKPRLSRSVRSVIADVGVFKCSKVDFIRTVVPFAGPIDDPVSTIARFLNEAPTSNALHLSRKAVVGLWPGHLLGAVIWPLAK